MNGSRQNAPFERVATLLNVGDLYDSISEGIGFSPIAV